MAKKTTKKTTPKGPIFKKRHGRLQISTFEDLTDDGKIRFSTYIQRTYLAKDGTWKAGPFSEEDLDDLVVARQLAVDHIEERKAAYSRQQLAA